MRRLILEAAFELFSKHGYAGATTRDIALKAGANEVLIFRYYGSKAGLFREAIIGPLTEFIKEYAEVRGQPHPQPLELSRAYTSGLLSMFEKHRSLFMALITASHYHPETIPGLEQIPELKSYFDAAKGTLLFRDDSLNMPPDLAVRLPFGLVGAMVLFSDWLFGEEVAFSRHELIEAAARMMIQGVIGRPPALPSDE